MKKLKLSAFALSLISLLHLSHVWAQTEGVDDFLGLESEIMPELEGRYKWTPKNFHQGHDLKVTESQVEVDKIPLKGQGHSLINWDEIDPEQWLNIDLWIKEREVKDKHADWKMRLRDVKQSELMGKLLSCVGECEIFRGTRSARGSFLSQLKEGDELKTKKDSVAWVYLMDGSLLRVAPESSVSLLEINLSEEEVFVLMRLNEGHSFIHPRKRELFVNQDGPETDSVSLPLKILEANQEFFERQIYKTQSDSKHLQDFMNPSAEAISAQVNKINELIVSNNEEFNLKTRMMIVTPTGTIESDQQSLDVVYIPGGKGYFKKRDGNNISLELRGYQANEKILISENAWYEIDPSGKSYTLLSSPNSELQIIELLTKRVKTFELARELWLKDFSIPIFAALKEEKKLAVEYGYAKWGKEHQIRLNFLNEYTRRIETTNLKSIQNLIGKLIRDGQVVNQELSQIYYQNALNHYLMGLKVRYTSRKLQVREMSDLQYYAWTLRHGKL
ncbi:MAG: hypothetical protein AB7I27_12120 [Bacteriovoracaceae bacterium]